MTESSIYKLFHNERKLKYSFAHTQEQEYACM